MTRGTAGAAPGVPGSASSPTLTANNTVVTSGVTGAASVTTVTAGMPCGKKVGKTSLTAVVASLASVTATISVT